MPQLNEQLAKEIQSGNLIKDFSGVSFSDLSLGSNISDLKVKEIKQEITETNKEVIYNEKSEYISIPSNKIQVPQYAQLLKNEDVNKIASSTYNIAKQVESQASEPRDNITAEVLATSISETSVVFNNPETAVSVNDKDNTNAIENSIYLDRDISWRDNSFAKDEKRVASREKLGALLDGSKTGITKAIQFIVDKVNGTLSDTSVMFNQLNEKLLGFSDALTDAGLDGSEAMGDFMGTAGKILEAYGSSMVAYKDGVTETAYGAGVESGWNAFYSAFDKENYFKSTPLDSSGRKYWKNIFLWNISIRLSFFV